MSYINSNDIFVYPCANRGEGFWESKLATEYSLRTLIPWKITKRSFVISDNPQDTNLEFVVNGYYFRVSDWRTKVPATSNLWAHIKINTKPLVSDSENTESTEILIPYDNVSTLDYNNGGTYEFHGILFDTTSANNDQTETYPYIFHLQITDSQGNFMHRDSIEIACEEPIEQDNNTGELSLKIGNGLQVSSNKLITRLGNGLEFGSGTDGEKPIQIKLATNSGLTRDANGLKVTNAVSDPVAPSNILQSLKINNVTYTIPQGKTYTASNQGIILDNTTFKLLTSDGLAIGVGDTGTNKYLRIALADSSGLNFDDSLPGKLSIKLADSSGLDKNNGLKINLNSTCGLTVDANNFLALKLASDSGLDKNSGLSLNLASKSGLDKSNGLKIKVNATSGLELTSDGLKMKYPLPSIDGNAKKILAVTSDGNSLEWVEKPSGGGGSGTVTSIGITGNDGISVSNSPITSSGNITLGLKLGSTLQYSNNYLNVKCKSSGGLAIDNNNGLYISENSWNATCNTETFYLYAQSTDYIARATVKALTLGKYCTLHITKVELTSQTTPSTTFSISSMTASDSDVRDRFLANTFYNSTVTFYGKNNHSIKLYVDDGINPHFLQLQFSPNITSDDWTDIKYVPITYILKN